MTHCSTGYIARRRCNTWTSLTTLALVASSFWISFSNAAPPAAPELQSQAPIANGVELRVLPIGDSITWGAQSSDENGYRKRLHEKLEARGNKVDFVGGNKSGNMPDNDHEGHRGFVISEINEASGVGIYAAANIALVHAGTNDMKNNIDPPNAPDRLKHLIDSIFKHSSDAVVLVCQIIPAGDGYPNTSVRIETFNEAIPGVVDSYTKAGKKVILVPMFKALTTSDLADGLHPNDGGYAKMADKYYAAIEAADKKGWISKPGKGSTPPSTDDWYPKPS